LIDNGSTLLSIIIGSGCHSGHSQVCYIWEVAIGL